MLKQIIVCGGGNVSFQYIDAITFITTRLIKYEIFIYSSIKKLI